MLRHTIKSIDESSSEIPPGWHLFIHEPSENFTENRMQTSGRVEYMYIDVGEEVEIKLTAQHFSMMANIDTKCSTKRAYSATKVIFIDNFLINCLNNESNNFSVVKCAAGSI